MERRPGPSQPRPRPHLAHRPNRPIRGRHRVAPSAPPHMKPPAFHRRRGSVLILALWALLLLSAAVFAWVKFIQQNAVYTGEANSGLDAKALAHSGVMVALHPQVT